MSYTFKVNKDEFWELVGMTNQKFVFDVSNAGHYVCVNVIQRIVCITLTLLKHVSKFMSFSTKKSSREEDTCS
jgi:hypothetical protein